MSLDSPLSRSSPRDAEARYELVFLNGPQSGRVFPIPATGAVLIGRRPPSDLQICEPTLSGVHAKLVLAEGRVTLNDLGSRNGTRINGRTVESGEVAHGDTLRLGSLELLFRDVDRIDTGFPAVLIDSGPLAGRRPKGTAFPGGADAEVLNLLFEVGRIACLPDTDEQLLVRDVLDLVRRHLGADRVAFRPEAVGHLAHYVTNEELGALIPRIPRHVLAEVRKGRTVSFAYGETGEGALDPSETVIAQGTRALVCAPVMYGEDFLGWFYADRIHTQGSFEKRAAEALSAVADVLASLLVRLRETRRSIELEGRIRERKDEMRVDVFLAGAAHDLSNLMTSLRSMAQLAAESPGRLDGLPESVLRLVDRGSLTLRTILALTGKLDDPQSVFDVRESVVGASYLIEQKMRMSGIRVAVRVHPRACLVEGSPAEIQDALLQLCLNAQSAMAEGGTLTLFVTPEDDHVSIRVADTGTGIPREILAQLEHPGRRKSTAGLDLVRTVVSRCGGKIEFRSKLGEGTTVEIRFPRIGAVAASARHDAEA